MIDDQELTRQLSNPKTRRSAFEILVRQYSEQLYWIIRRMVLSHDDANDLLQNTFLKAWNGIESFHGDSKISTWLSRIAINVATDFLRQQKTRLMISTDTETGVAQSLAADDYFDGDHTQALLQEAIAQLPEVQRTVFQLRYYDEMKYSEMSQLLNTSEGALKASYHIAVKKIAEYLKAHD